MQRLNELLAADFKWSLEDNPEYASQCGIHDYADRLQDLSPAAFKRRIEHGEANPACYVEFSLSEVREQ